MSTTKRIIAAVIMTGALATAGIAQASAAEAQARPDAARPGIDQIGVVDTLLDTVDDPFSQVYNTAVGLLRALGTPRL